MQIHKYVKKDKMRKLKAFFFCSEDEGGENRTSDRATVDEMSPSPPSFSLRTNKCKEY